jgi:ankyrin repeat protein
MMMMQFKKFKAPLMAATWVGNNELMKFLLKRDVQMHSPFSELHLAAEIGNTSGCEILLDAGADIDAIDVNEHTVGLGGATPLTIAVIGGTWKL